MATITYLDVDKTADEVTIKGVKFKANEAVETNDPDLIKTFKNHPHFKVSGDYDPQKPAETKPPPEKPAPSTSTTAKK